MSLDSRLLVVSLAFAFGLAPVAGAGGPPPTQEDLDTQVRAFLESRQSSWRDMNVPARDGQFLHDMIVEHGYTRALEIGTSTGHSTIWMAWAMSRTGGKVVTLEIDEARRQEALANFEEAGVAGYVDSRLGDAHELVKTLENPFDFVFSDADKGWYTQYFIDVAPKMVPGGCYVSHNIDMRGMDAYLEYLRSRPDFTTTISDERTTPIAVTCKLDSRRPPTPTGRP